MPLDDDTVDAPPAGESIGDAVRAAFEKADAPTQDTAEAPPASEVAADPTEASGERPRGPDGKFLPKDAAADAPKPAADPKAAEPVASAPKPDAPKASEPPANWSEADKTLFKGASPEIQALVARREAERDADYTRKTQAVAALKRDYEPVAEIFRPHAAEMQAKGMSPATIVNGWYQAEKALMEGRGAGLVADVVRNYKIDPREVAKALGLTLAQNGAGVDAPPAPSPPNGQHIQLPVEFTEKLSQIDQFLAQQRQRDAERVQAQQQEATTRVLSTIEQFAAAKGTDGQPAHPFFAEVEDQMAHLLLSAKQAGLAQPSLDDLYDQAVWANPSTRAKQLEASRAADEALRTAETVKRQEEARAKAEKSRRAASSVTGSPGSGQAQTSRRGSSGSLRDDILAADEELAA